MKHLTKRRHNVALTLNRGGANVLPTTEASQRLLDIAARAEADEGIRQGLEDERKGRLHPAREFFAEFESDHGISR